MIVTHPSIEATDRASGQGTQRQAFTILELIVAVSITVIMLFLINTLFQATSNGVSMGMALSDVIGAGRAVSDQIERDAEQQFTPGGESGVLVIVCQKYTGVPFKHRGIEGTRDVRSDQFMFIRDLGTSSNGFSAAPITPLDNTTFSSPSQTQMTDTQAIRVWYGHVLKTNEAGTAATDLGTAGANYYANQWALGRHALFINESDTALAFNHSTGAVADAAVNVITLAGVGSPKLFNGTTDVAHLKYQGDATAAAAAPGVFVAGVAGSGGTNPSTLWLGDADYHAKALSYMFLGSNRLWTNPFPKIDPTVTTTWVTAGQIAQMHPLMMDNVSDFIVEFAADAVDDAGIVNDASGFDGEPDREPAVTGEIVWYGLATNTNTNSKAPPTSWNLGTTGLVSPVASLSGAAAYVFQHGGDNGKLWPYMIRLRYRVHDSRSQLAGDVSPESDATNSGRWFEQIIQIRRE